MSKRALAPLLLAALGLVFVWHQLDSEERASGQSIEGPATPTAPLPHLAAEIGATTVATPVEESSREAISVSTSSETDADTEGLRGTLRGSLFDERDAPLAGCTVVLERETRATEDGKERLEIDVSGNRFEVPRLQVGSWSVYAQRGGAR